MGFLIDTNVLSEVQKGDRADPGVRDWYAKAHIGDLYLSRSLFWVRCGRESNVCGAATPLRPSD
jgi:hypothetical protein